MAVDISRVLLAAAQAALGDKPPTKKKGLSTGRALAAGAVLAVAWGVATGPGARFVRDKVQERLSDDSELEPEEEPEAVLEEDEEPAYELDVDKEPEAEVEQDEDPEAGVPEDGGPETPRKSKTPLIFDRPRPRRPVGPKRRPPHPKGDSDQTPTLSAPRRPRRPRAPSGRP
jgi:hypothetical protein